MSQRKDKQTEPQPAPLRESVDRSGKLHDLEKNHMTPRPVTQVQPTAKAKCPKKPKLGESDGGDKPA
jgi:hypothetical protein